MVISGYRYEFIYPILRLCTRFDGNSNAISRDNYPYRIFTFISYY